MTHRVSVRLVTLSTMRWSGVVLVRSSKTGDELGRVYMRDGQILWAEGRGQEKTLFDTLAFIGGLEQDELQFLLDLLSRQESEDEEQTSFMAAVCQSGYLSTWATREALRVHIYEAIRALESDDALMEEHPSEEMIGGVPFTLTELYFGERLDSTLHSMPSLEQLGVWRVEIWHPSRGPGIVWPKESPPWAMLNYRFPVVLEAGAANPNQTPKVTLQYFSSSIVAGVRLPDPYGTLIMVELANSSVAPTIVTLLYYTPTFFILRALKEVDPVQELL